MIGFRHADPRYPFLWEGAGQPAARWHAAGDGPAHYFCDTPDGAWAEFLRHEEISDPDDFGDHPTRPVGGRPRRPSCRGNAHGPYPPVRRKRLDAGHGCTRAVSADRGVGPRGPRGWRVDGGFQPASRAPAGSSCSSAGARGRLVPACVRPCESFRPKCALPCPFALDNRRSRVHDGAVPCEDAAIRAVPKGRLEETTGGRAK